MKHQLKQAAKAMDKAPFNKEGRMYFKDGQVYKVETPKLTLGSLFPFKERSKEGE